MYLAEQTQGLLLHKQCESTKSQASQCYNRSVIAPPLLFIYLNLYSTTHLTTPLFSWVYHPTPKAEAEKLEKGGIGTVGSDNYIPQRTSEVVFVEPGHVSACPYFFVISFFSRKERTRPPRKKRELQLQKKETIFSLIFRLIRLSHFSQERKIML